MGDGILHDLPPNENISGTLDDTQPEVTSDLANFNYSVRPVSPCGYVLAAPRPGHPARFCDAPAVPGSSYCAGHRALCQVAPGSKAARRITARQARVPAHVPPPPHLASVPVPEPSEPDPDDVRDALDLPRAATAEDAE